MSNQNVGASASIVRRSCPWFSISTPQTETLETPLTSMFAAGTPTASTSVLQIVPRLVGGTVAPPLIDQTASLLFFRIAHIPLSAQSVTGPLSDPVVGNAFAA